MDNRKLSRIRSCMPKNAPVFRTIFSAFVIWGLMTGADARAETLSFCYDPYPPYTFGDEGPPTGGTKVRLLEAVTERIDGLTTTVELLPWQRCQIMVQSGQIDGILPLFPNEERGQYMVFSEDAFLQESVFWFNPTRFPNGLAWTGDYGSIAELKLGMLRGSVIDADMEAAFSAAGEITRADSVEALFLMLKHKRVDLVAIDYSVGRHHAAAIGEADSFVRLNRPISVRPSNFGLSRQTGAYKYLADFDRAIEELRTSGDLFRIQNDISN